MLLRLLPAFLCLAVWPCWAAKTLIISFDGFRWDYLDRHPTPNMDRVIAEGFRVRQVRPAFPALTFPNHVTLVTGLTPDQHGITANEIYDRQSGREFDTSPPKEVDQPFWYQAPMLWEQARAHKRRSAVYFWVGSEVIGRHPDRFFNFSYDVPIATRLKRLQRWLNPNRRPNPDLMMLYFFEADSIGHKHGPNSPELAATIKQLDDAVGEILAMLAAHKEPVHLFFVSDHGMAECRGEGVNIKDIEAAVPERLRQKVVHNWTQTNIFLKSPSPKDLQSVLKQLPQRPYLKWYTRETFPHGLHPHRNGDIIGIFAKGYQILVDGGFRVYGAHGYPIEEPDMAAICFGRSPAIKPGSTLAQTNMVDFFPLVAYLMKLEHGPVAGKLEVWQDILINPPPKAIPTQPPPTKEKPTHE